VAPVDYIAQIGIEVSFLATSHDSWAMGSTTTAFT